jgi:hypothetical protein
MKTTLLLSTLLVVATPSFAQSPPNSYSPAFGYPSYAAPGARSPTASAPVSFGAWETGYAWDGGARVRSRNHE